MTLCGRWYFRRSSGERQASVAAATANCSAAACCRFITAEAPIANTATPIAHRPRTATALLRADFTGLQSGSAAPGFSLLRAFSNQIVKDVNDSAQEAAQSRLVASPDPDRLAPIAFRCLERAFPPSVGGDGSSVVKETLVVQIGALYGGLKSTVPETRMSAHESLIAVALQLIVKFKISSEASGIR